MNDFKNKIKDIGKKAKKTTHRPPIQQLVEEEREERTTVVLPPGVKMRVDIYCSTSGQTLKNFITNAILEALPEGF